MKKSRLESTNFLTNVIVLIFMGLAATGITTTLDPEQTSVAIMAKDMEFIFQMLIPAGFTMGAKIWKNIQAGTFSFKAMIKSPNFITQAITVLASILGLIGIMLPETASTELTTAIFSGSVITIIGAVIANVINPLWHFLKPILFPPKDVPAPVKPTR